MSDIQLEDKEDGIGCTCFDNIQDRLMTYRFGGTFPLCPHCRRALQKKEKEAPPFFKRTPPLKYSEVV